MTECGLARVDMFVNASATEIARTDLNTTMIASQADLLLPP